MSVQKEYDGFKLVCDICQNGTYESFDYWSDATDYGLANGWKRKHEGGGWINICPDCQE